MPFIRATTTVENIQNTITSSDAPQFPTVGQMWLDTSVTPPIVRQWNGTEWVIVHLDIKQLDPVSMDEINKIIQDTINEVNSSRGEIDEALKQAQDAIEKANVANGNVEKVTVDVNEAKKNAQDAIDKANLNDASITEIKKQQSEDGQKIADVSQNYNGIQQSVTNLATKQESDRTQLAGMIQDKVSNEDFESSNTMLADRIDEAISSSDGKFNAMQSTIDSTTQTIKGLDNRVTQNTTSINGINTTVQNKADKTEVTQLAGQISETVENQEATNQRVATAEKNISALTTSDGNQNKRLDTAEKSIRTISTKTDNNTELINETKKTADSNSSKIVDTSGRVSTVEQTLTKQSQTIADNTGKINKATQDIDSAKRTISDVSGRVSKVEQKADGISSTVSKVQTDLNTTNSKLDNKADTSYVNNKVDGISIGGTNILKNTEKMDNSTGNYWINEGNVTLQDGVVTVQQKWASREYLLDDLNKYIENNDVKNKKYILSVDIMRTTQDIISNTQIRFYLEQSGSHAAILVDDLSKLPINKWVRKSVSIILLGQNETSLTKGRFRIECTTNNEWKFRRMKLEEGTKATDWSPSPEDNASQSDLNNTNNRLNGVDSNLNGLLNTGTNCWINSNFADGLNHWWKQNNNIQLKLDGEYLGTKVLDIKVPTNAGWVSAGTQERYPVTPGEKLSFSWWQNLIVTSSNNTFGEIQCYKDTTSGRIGTARLAPSDQTVNKWVLMKSEGWTVPKDCYYIGVNFCFSTNGEMKITQPQFVHGSKIPNYQPSPNDLNNIQSDVDLNKSQIQSQQTQLNQKPDRTEIIASSNDNPRAYFQVGTFSSGPNAGRGYVSVGADYGFFLKTNTFIEDGFVLSAKHISAGQLVANTPAWITSSTDNWKVDKNSYVTKYDLDRSNIFLGPTGMTNKAFTAMSLENGGIQFLYDNNGNTRAGFKTVGYMVPYVASSSTPEIQILGASAKYGLSIIGDDTAPYNRLLNDKGRVFIGKDSLAGEGTAAIASNTVYTCRLQSLRDSDNNGISVDDRLLIDEGLWSKWNSNGKQTHIDFPNKNGGDVIEFHTAEGDGAFSDYKAYFQMVNGNWISGGVDAQHHAIVVGGNGYILSFSNEDTTDNAQGNGNAIVVAKKFVTNSSKELKTDIQPISDIDQAVKDILKIEPKQYLYQSQVDQLSEWEDNGKPADTFKHLDTEINVGLIAEEMDEYDSLRPFIEKVSDEEGNEGILGIDYSKLTPLLLAVCQKQDNKINELEERLVRMELLMKDLHS